MDIILVFWSFRYSGLDLLGKVIHGRVHFLRKDNKTSRHSPRPCSITNICIVLKVINFECSGVIKVSDQTRFWCKSWRFCCLKCPSGGLEYNGNE